LSSSPALIHEPRRELNLTQMRLCLLRMLLQLSLRVSLRLPTTKSGAETVCLVVDVNDCSIDEFSVDDDNDGPDASEEDPNVEDPGGRSGCEYKCAEFIECANDKGCMASTQA